MLFDCVIIIAAVIFIVLMIILSICFEAIEGHLDTINHHLREIAEAIKNSREQPESSESGGNENKSEQEHGDDSKTKI